MKKLSLLAAIAFSLFAAPHAHGDTLSTFTIAGTFSDNSKVTGSIVIDTSTGVFESGDLSYLGNAFDFTIATSPDPTNDAFIFILSDTNGAYTSFPELYLALATQNPTGYSGGTLCSDSAPCNGGASVYVATSASTQLDLSSGTATFASSITTGPAATPEPSSLLLLGTGLAGCAGTALRRLRRKA